METRQSESAIEALFRQTKKISSPPAYFTPDWETAYESIKKLASLSPEVVATGHGKPMEGEEMRRQLNYLKKNFYNEFIPQHGRYVYEAAVADANGLLYVPPAAYNPYIKWMIVGSTVIITTIVMSVLLKKRKKYLINLLY